MTSTEGKAATTEPPRKADADRGSREYVADTLAKKDLPQGVEEHVVSSAHEEAMAAADQATATLQEHAPAHSLPGMGHHTGEQELTVEVQLPSAADWERTLHPVAIETAPLHVVTTDVDAHTFTAPSQWPGARPKVDLAHSLHALRGVRCFGLPFVDDEVVS